MENRRKLSFNNHNKPILKIKSPVAGLDSSPGIELYLSVAFQNLMSIHAKHESNPLKALQKLTLQKFNIKILQVRDLDIKVGLVPRKILDKFLGHTWIKSNEVYAKAYIVKT